jgi:hypothetical protein
MQARSIEAIPIPSTEFRFTSTDGLQIGCARWDSRGPVRGVVQIARTVWATYWAIPRPD